MIYYGTILVHITLTVFVEQALYLYPRMCFRKGGLVKIFNVNASRSSLSIYTFYLGELFGRLIAVLALAYTFYSALSDDEGRRTNVAVIQQNRPAHYYSPRYVHFGTFFLVKLVHVTESICLSFIGNYNEHGYT